MTCSFSRNFEKRLQRLPKAERKRALRAVDTWLENPNHPGLRFKTLRGQNNLWSLRCGQNYRMLGKRYGNEIMWDWIGTHNDYDKKMKRL